MSVFKQVIDESLLSYLLEQHPNLRAINCAGCRLEDSQIAKICSRNHSLEVMLLRANFIEDIVGKVNCHQTFRDDCWTSGPPDSHVDKIA